MEQKRFSNLSILCIERNIANFIDTQLIVDKCSKKDRRITLYEIIFLLICVMSFYLCNLL